MFNVNDMILYGNSEVCKIIDICFKDLVDKERLYYILQPIYDVSTIIYCLVDSEKANIRKLLTAEDMHELINIKPDDISDITEWNENDKIRNEAQSNVLRKGNRRELVKLIKTLYIKREEKINQGKKLYFKDEKALANAEKILYQEFATVLDIEPDDVVPFIMGNIEVEM